MEPATSDSFSWRQVAVPVYGPTLLVSIGAGAILPLVALSARDLGASVGIAALVVAMLGIGQLVGDLPAGALAARIGERRALIIACLVDVLALIWAYLAPTVLTLSAAVFVAGLANAVFSLARQAYRCTGSRDRDGHRDIGVGRRRGGAHAQDAGRRLVA